MSHSWIDFAGDVNMFLHALPAEAINYSRDGVAVGIDLLPYGEEFHRIHGHPGTLIAIANRDAVRWKKVSQEERDAWFTENRERHRLGEERRHRQPPWNIWIPWDQLSEENYDYLMTLLWLPRDPYSSLEMLALQCEG